jgi:O-antigen/teichoic acid export membrane protein
MSDRAVATSEGRVTEFSGAAVPLSLKKNFAWTLMGNVVYAGCQWMMLMVMAKLGSPEQVGQFSLGLAVTAPVITFANLQLRGIQATDARREYTFGDYLTLRLITTTAAVAFIFGMAFIGHYQIETAHVIFWVGASEAADVLSDICYGLFQQEERMDRVSRSMLIKGPVSLVALTLGIYLTGKVSWGVAGLAVASAGMLFGYDMRVGRALLGARNSLGDFRPRWNGQVLSRLALTALPLGLVMSLISLNGNMPRYFLERVLGERDLGIFSAIAYLVVAGSTVVSALGQSASPRLAKHYAAGDAPGFRRLLLQLVGVGAGLGVGGVLFTWVLGKPLLTLLYKAEYGQHRDILVLSMVAAAIGFVGSFLGYGMTAARYFKAQLPLFAAVTVILAAACYWLVPAFGLRGAAMASIIGAFVQTLGSGVIVLVALRRLVDASQKGSAT